MHSDHSLANSLRRFLAGILVLSGVIFSYSASLAKNPQEPHAESFLKNGLRPESMIEQSAEERLSRHLDRLVAFLGTPYRSGGTGASGMDCSGLVQRYYMEVFGIQLPHSAYLQSRSGLLTNVPNDPDDLQAGDLLFFRTKSKRINHVAIYLSDGRFIHATSSGGVIVSRLDEAYWRARLVSIRRASEKLWSMAQK